MQPRCNLCQLGASDNGKSAAIQRRLPGDGENWLLVEAFPSFVDQGTSIETPKSYKNQKLQSTFPERPDSWMGCL